MITVHDLWKGYGSIEVLKGLNLEIMDGETLVILGRSGVGKSVLLRQIIGIERPDKGYVEVNGVRISNLNQYQLFNAVKSMGMLFQGAALFDSLNIGENVAFHLRQHSPELSDSEIKKRVTEALKMVDLSGTENKMPSEMSGGMRKRAAIARLWIYKPRILLFDEPTTGLDPITAGQINELIRATQKELKATSVVVTHDIRSALEVGDRIAFHDQGKIIAIAPKAEFLKINNPLLQSFISEAIIPAEYFSKKG